MKKVILASVFTAVSAMSANAASIVNGSFEDLSGAVQTADNGSWGLFDSITGWDKNGPNNNSFEIQTNTVLNAQDGDNYVELDAHGSGSNTGIRQSVSLDIGEYELSFYYSPRVSASPSDSGNTNRIRFRVREDGPAPRDTLVNSAVNGPNNNNQHGVWTEITRTFIVGEAGSYNFDFWAVGEEDTLGGFIDNVSLSAVPLPAPALMLLAGIGALGAMRRKKA